MSLAPPVTSVVTTRDGERLFVAEWPGAGLPFVFAPGLTSSHRAISGVADVVDAAFPIIGFDLRGRGNSTKPPPGSYGMQRHAGDMLDVLDAFGVGRFVAGGHSMGAYAATALATLAPDRAAGLVLIDGGVLPAFLANAAVDVDALLHSTIGAAMQRLVTVYESPEQFLEQQSGQDYFEGLLDPVVKQYFLYDLERVRGGYQPKCDVQAATEDWRDLFSEATATRLEQVACPVLAIAAEMGLNREGPRVLGESQRARLTGCVSDVTWVDVGGTTHHTVLVSERGSKQSADALASFMEKLA